LPLDVGGCRRAGGRVARRADPRLVEDRAQADGLEPILARHGIRLRRDVLEDRSRSFGGAVRERARRMQPVTGSLHRALDRLESSLHSLR
jgi:hypothetical protein